MLHDQSDFFSVLESLERLLSWIQQCPIQVVPSEAWPTFQTALVDHWGLSSTPWRWPQDINLQQDNSVLRLALKAIVTLCNPKIIENLCTILHNNFDAVLNKQSMKQVYEKWMSRLYDHVKMTLEENGLSLHQILIQMPAATKDNCSTISGFALFVAQMRENYILVMIMNYSLLGFDTSQ
jgi:hypothetical protein